MTAPFPKLALVTFVAALLGGATTGSAADSTGNRYGQSGPAADPHLDGNAYRALRGGKAFDVIEFGLQVADQEKARALTVSLGPDYVIEKENDSVTIYDFRLRRVLELTAGGKDFANESLFGRWHLRYAFLQNNLSSVELWTIFGGSKEKPELMRFWVEQKNGLTDPRKTVGKSLTRPEIRTRTGSGRTIVQAEGTTVATVTPGNIKFPSPAHASTYSAWLAWSMHFHPDVAGKIARTANLPARIDRVTGDLGSWKRKSAVLRVQNASMSTGGLDILAGRAAKIPSWEPHLPEALAALMVSAARGKAANGPVSDQEYTNRITGLVNQNKLFDAALLSMHAAQPYDGCANQQLSRALCGAVAMAQRRSSRSDQRSRTLFRAIELNSSMGEPAEGARTFISLRSRNMARPDILEFMILNALVGAKMYQPKKFDARLKKEFDGFLPRIVSAFGQDPYDPFRYRVYYNYLRAAASSVEEAYLVNVRAYPVVDLARVLPQRRMPKIISSITESETKIARDYPVHFPNF